MSSSSHGRAAGRIFGLERVHFEDRARAELNLERIRARVSSNVLQALSQLLAEVPDPDTALNYFERLTEREDTGVMEFLSRHPVVIHYALTVFSHSPFLGETLLASPDLLIGPGREQSLHRSQGREGFREELARFRSRSAESDLAPLLARFKRREYVRIVLRDVLDVAGLAETTDEISCLSDVLIEEAVADCASNLCRRYGTPQVTDRRGKVVEPRFSVLALGKLGGNELNYSSDVDLMFLYEGEGLESEAPTTREYFVRLAQSITEVLSRVTKDGFVFRIDLRLRPQGREGESAVSLQSAIRYYKDSAEDWERQAMIKARHCAGEESLSREFLGAISADVYTADVNFAAIETALRTRDQLALRRKSAGDSEGGPDVKLDRGGIRDIEFLVQCLQRVYGGKEPWLQSRGTLFALQKLHDKEHISGADYQALTNAYEFLRNVEHRLQLRQGRQTHRVPTDPDVLRVLARSLDVESSQLVDELREKMGAVAGIYARIIHHQRQQTPEQAEETFALRTKDFSFGRVHSEHQILQRLATDNSGLYEIASRSDLQPHTRRNLFRFLGSAFTSGDRYDVVASAPEMVRKAIPIFATSDYLTDTLVRHPEDISSLGELRASTPRHQPVLFSEEQPVHSGLSPALLEYMSRTDIPRKDKFALMRRRFRHQMFLSGARDVIEARPVAASLADSTAAADEAVNVAYVAAGRLSGLAVLALGRLGSSEFDCLSDVDLLFVRGPNENAQVLTIAAETMVAALSSYTNEGTVFPVDLRLRPHGGEGEMTITPVVLGGYIATEAQSWEALTYTKLRFVGGDERLGAEAVASVVMAYSRFGEENNFGKEVREMRLKLEAQTDEGNIRTAPGGMYDIDFLVAFLVVKHGVQTVSGNTRERLKHLGRAGLIQAADLQVLLDASELFRTTEHAVRLVTGRALRELPVSDNARTSVEGIVERILGPQKNQLQDLLSQTSIRVRKIFERTVH